MLRWVTKYTRTAFPKYRLVEKKEVSQASHTSLHSVCTWQYCAIHNHSGFDVTSPLLCLHVQCTIQCVFTVFGPKKGVMKVSWCKPGNPSPEDELSDGVVAMGDSGRSGWGGTECTIWWSSSVSYTALLSVWVWRAEWYAEQIMLQGFWEILQLRFESQFYLEV